MSDRARRIPLRFARPALLALALAIAAFAVIRAIPPRQVTIETGPVGGSYYKTALKYRDALQKRGIAVNLRAKADSLEIVGDVDRDGAGVDIGFTAQAVQRDRFPHTASAGAIELQPLFIFYAAALGEMTSPSGLHGKRIVMPDERSATSEAALRVLRLYGVTAENSRIAFMPLVDAARALKAGAFDAGLFMLDPSNALVVELAKTDRLRLLSLSDGLAVSRLLPFLHPTILPHRVYDVEGDIPPNNVEVVAAKVNVVVRKDIRPAVLYTLLDAMNEVHSDATLVSDAGEFPSVVGTELPPHPLAKEYAKTGAPWFYRDLPLPLASVIDSYLIIGIAIFLATEVFKSSKYLSELVEFVVDHLCLGVLAHIERKTRPGRPVGKLQFFLVHIAERAMSRTSKRKRSQELIGRIRNHATRTAD
ncbi:MAG TPA: TAXI family TRAP transporter solute-binding subunit [Aliidongia sp.]|nr:TAXI family TRAP transporter solute-binding subunit [Aliidongia sp.]